MNTKSKASSTSTDEQISKAFDLRKKGMGMSLIASSTGLPESTLYSWFREPPKKLIERIINTPTLKYLVDAHKTLQQAIWLDPVVSDQERTTIPVVDRRGTGTGYSSQYGINEEVGRVNRENSESPVLTSAMTSEDKLEFQSQEIVEDVNLEDKTADTITYQGSSTYGKEIPISSVKMSGSIKPFEINSKNILELNNKLVDYKLTLSAHIGEVDRLLKDLESLAYIESLENAEIEYQDRIKALEVEIDRLKQAERPL